MDQSTLDIKSYWDSKAETLKTDPSATMKDTILRSLEIEAIASRLQADDVLLDVGCGNAFGSIRFAEKCGRVVAADYSSNMVAMARQAIADSGYTNVHAEEADVLNLDAAFPEKFTAVCSVRCLINLPQEEQQYRAVEQLGRVLRPGGRLFLIEGIAEHWEALNASRRQAGLLAMELDWHNRLFCKTDLERALHEFSEIEEVVDFGEYYFLSRIVHPLLVSPQEPEFDGPLNKVARAVWQNSVARGRFRDISTLVLYVCRKRRDASHP